MSLRRFWGKDMTAALRAVRNSLGPDALILETKNISEGSGIEITALGGAEDKSNDRPPPIPSFISAPIEEMRDEIASLRSMLSWLAPKIQKNDVLKSLVSHGVSPDIMGRISEAMRESPGTNDREKMYGALRRLIPSGGQIEDAVDRLAFMGPAGVGKTTSLIRLTVFESQRLTRRIGWVNADQRRLSGDDGLA